MLSKDIIIETLKKLQPFFLHMAVAHHIDYEDLRQDAALFMLEQLGKPDHSAKSEDQMRGYLFIACKQRCTFKLADAYAYAYRTGVTITSLDDENGAMALVDELEQPVITDDTTRQDQKAAALYRALRRLRLDEQQYMREVFQLNAYQPLIHPPYPKEKSRTRNRICQAAYGKLRHNRQLAREVQAI